MSPVLLNFQLMDYLFLQCQSEERQREKKKLIVHLHFYGNMRGCHQFWAGIADL